MVDRPARKRNDRADFAGWLKPDIYAGRWMEDSSASAPALTATELGP